jgi:hypothetical protein
MKVDSFDASGPEIFRYTVGPPYPLIQYPRFAAAGKKNWKIKEINGSQVSNRAPGENGP